MNEPQVHCPFCDGSDTKLFAAFGSQLAVSTYWCNRCHTAFEKLKAPARSSATAPKPESR